MFRLCLTLLLLTPLPGWAQDLKVSGDTKVKPYKLVSLKVEGVPPGYTILWDVYPEDSVSSSVNQKLRSTYEFVAPPGTYKVKVRAFKEEAVLEQRVEVTIGTPPTPPGPVPPGPNPPGPTPPGPTPPNPPAPVTSFRVLFVWESGTPLTAAQNSVINGLATAEYLDATTTKTDNTRGWRLYDKDRATDNDTATWNALWAAVKPKVTAVPCVAVEVNGKVDILPLGATPADMLATFKTYAGGK